MTGSVSRMNTGRCSPDACARLKSLAHDFHASQELPMSWNLQRARRWGRRAPPAPPAKLSPSKGMAQPIFAARQKLRGDGYDRYALWDSVVLQPKGGGEQQGILPMDPSSKPYTYSLSYTQAEATAAGSPTLYDFRFSVRMPAGFCRHFPRAAGGSCPAPPSALRGWYWPPKSTDRGVK